MPVIDYTGKEMTGVRAQMVGIARRIAQEFADDGYNLTLRQLYYQFVANDLFPDDRAYAQTTAGKWVKHPDGTKNAEPNYKWLGDIVNDARMAGYIDWDTLVDRTREEAGGTGHMEDPADIIDPRYYWTDKWAGQEYYVEVWVEKEALSEIAARGAERLEATYFCCRGYVSASAQWRAAQRMVDAIRDNKKVRIIHLGDHDPSGIDMTRDIRDRLATFIAQDMGYAGPGEEAWYYGEMLEDQFEVERIALNMDQIRTHNPPPNPAKLTDSRGSGYVAKYGMKSWELDALTPRILVPMIEQAITQYVDVDLFNERVREEKQQREILEQCKDRWEDVVEFLTDEQ
jgi:hypothetical protein